MRVTVETASSISKETGLVKDSTGNVSSARFLPPEPAAAAKFRARGSTVQTTFPVLGDRVP